MWRGESNRATVRDAVETADVASGLADAEQDHAEGGRREATDARLAVRRLTGRAVRPYAALDLRQLIGRWRSLIDRRLGHRAAIAHDRVVDTGG